MPFDTLMSHTALYGKKLNLDLMDVLGSDTPEQKEALAHGLGEDAKRRQLLQQGKTALTLSELATALQALEEAKFKADPGKMKSTASAMKSPFKQQAFYDFLRERNDAVKMLQENLQRLRDEVKTEKGFLKANFNIFSHKNPVEKALEDVVSFDAYCRRNNITFDEVKKELVQVEAPKTLLGKIKEQRFLIAAAGGAVLGLAGVNLGVVPLLAAAPAVFFGALPWLAAPFIGLNIFKSFSEHSMVKEAPTLLRFGAITAAGLAISLGVTTLMTGIIPPVDPSTIQAMAGGVAGSGGFSPMQYMLPIIGAFSVAAIAYKKAKSVLTGELADIEENNEKKAELSVAVKKLSHAFNKVSGIVMNKHTAPAIAAAGKFGEKATGMINKVFPRFIDIAGIPAIAVMMSTTMAAGGLGLLGAFAGYYATAFVGLAVGGIAMAAAYYAAGCRGKDFKELGKTALAGFSLSSSSACMDIEKGCLKKMGVSAKTRNAVVPLGGVFNMYGTSLYMGLTAFYAMTMFMAAPTAGAYLMTAGTVLAIALGAPGIPSSNISLLEPVLQQTGLLSSQIHKVYAMVLPADRLLDMTQSALNVLGDMFAAGHQDRHRLRYQRVKNIRKIRADQLAKNVAPPPAP